MPRVCLQFVIVEVPDHTHFFCFPFMFSVVGLSSEGYSFGVCLSIRSTVCMTVHSFVCPFVHPEPDLSTF